TVRADWIGRMVRGPQLVEKLTLFWHNHFATSILKVNDAGLMRRQIELLRKHALGKFPGLLQDVSRDPAMLVWLDAASNRPGAPNENYARELMELFSLGVGNYTEKDVQQAARAFTGWKVAAGQPSFSRDDHDGGSKTILGRTGFWTGEDVVRICLDQPAC